MTDQKQMAKLKKMTMRKLDDFVNQLEKRNQVLKKGMKSLEESKNNHTK